MVKQNELGIPRGAHKRTKRIGRGDGSGKGNYSTAGRKGQQARTGRGHQRPGMEGNQLPFILRIPSQRGFNNKFAIRYAIVNLEQLEKVGESGKNLTPEWMIAMGLVKDPHALVKVLGEGELTKTLQVTAHKFSKSAKEKIEERGGTVTKAASFTEKKA